MNKLKLHLLVLPRWFAAPFFGTSVLMGAVLAGGGFSDLSTWIGLLIGMLIMAGGHSFNSLLDYSWTGLDKGDERSASKTYTSGQSVIAAGLISTREVLINALCWYTAAGVIAVLMFPVTGYKLLLIVFLGMLVTFWYSVSKFNWTHELALGTGVGPLAALTGAFAVNPNPNVCSILLVSAIFAIILSYAGLALDEYPDAEANLKKGVKSIAYKVWEYKFDLSTYIGMWLLVVYIYQVFLISVGILSHMTGITFILAPLFMFILVIMKGSIQKATTPILITAAAYQVLLVVGQIL